MKHGEVAQLSNKHLHQWVDFSKILEDFTFLSANRLTGNSNRPNRKSWYICKCAIINRYTGHDKTSMPHHGCFNWFRLYSLPSLVLGWHTPKPLAIEMYSILYSTQVLRNNLTGKNGHKPHQKVFPMYVWPNQLSHQVAIMDTNSELLTYVQISGLPSLCPLNSTWATATDATLTSFEMENVKDVGLCSGPYGYDSRPDYVIFIDWIHEGVSARYPLRPNGVRYLG